MNHDHCETACTTPEAGASQPDIDQLKDEWDELSDTDTCVFRERLLDLAHVRDTVCASRPPIFDRNLEPMRRLRWSSTETAPPPVPFCSSSSLKQRLCCHEATLLETAPDVSTSSENSEDEDNIDIFLSNLLISSE
mmetsp:Transcript_80231/g.215001  ORF Transcript_80231/g.215001 Transcript_80231/m.215001 type:complete len:136 (+) Transcript_80231:98-505(+)|eukprot:CAMPEP_0113722688 /NCGR_PEP_ID=MMETSP0038_2-20120614/37921_1 /TAXON_ID=2898 /ORGANISM="Cryptomonas paramecium" /LENGTH=135 /DNA_ID=CAMNT_0000652023 /DNA_START=219 /DNA_END=626 /DNA_ORIENTATION=- /assembly_acc=CAM_ASM_000170